MTEIYSMVLLQKGQLSEMKNKITIDFHAPRVKGTFHAEVTNRRRKKTLLHTLNKSLSPPTFSNS